MSGKKGKVKELTDDELLEQCIKENAQCFHTGCTKSIKTIRLTCQLCHKDFCTSHHQPEVHGCGVAAKKDAAAPVKKTLRPEQAEKLENKLSKKLQQMKNERKKKEK